MKKPKYYFYQEYWLLKMGVVSDISKKAND